MGLRLRTIILMLAYLCATGYRSVEEQVNILDRFGLSDKDIATVLGCTQKEILRSRALNTIRRRDEKESTHARR